MQPAVITVGRMNPPTRGHAVLVKKVIEEAKRIGARPFLFIVDGAKTSEDKIKNPLTGQQREHIVKKLFPGVTVDIVSNAYEALEVLDLQGMAPKIWVAGSDRAPKYRKLLLSEKLDGEVVEVDREAGEADGVSATAARQAALANDWETFQIMMPRDADPELLVKIMKEIREATYGPKNPIHGTSRREDENR